MSDDLVMKINKCCHIPIRELKTLWKKSTGKDMGAKMNSFKQLLFMAYPSCQKLWKIGSDCFSLKDAKDHEKNILDKPDDTVYFKTPMKEALLKSKGVT